MSSEKTDAVASNISEQNQTVPTIVCRADLPQAIVSFPALPLGILGTQSCAPSVSAISGRIHAIKPILCGPARTAKINRIGRTLAEIATRTILQ